MQHSPVRTFMLILTTIRYVSVICTRSCSAALHIHMCVPVVTWLPAHWPRICTHIVQHVSEGASNDAVNDFKGICRSYAKQCGSTCLHIYIYSHWSFGDSCNATTSCDLSVVAMHSCHCIPRTLRYNIVMEVLIMLPKGATLHT